MASSEAASASSKVVVMLRATGSAPILKKNKFAISDQEKFKTVVDTLRKMLHLQPGESVFAYINQAFQPSLDETVANLYQSFQIDGKLTINYSMTPAWG